MHRLILPPLLLLSLAVALATPGSAESPTEVLNDPAGDTDERLDPFGHHDLLGITVKRQPLRGEHAGSMAISLRQVDAAGSGTYDVTWDLAAAYDVTQVVDRTGIRVTWSPNAVRWQYLEQVDGGWETGRSGGQARLVPGTPGGFVVDHPLVFASEWLHLANFTATSYGAAGPQGLAEPLDEAASPGIQFRVVPPITFAAAEDVAPAGKADFAADASASLPPPARLESVWLDFTPRGATITMALHQLNAASLSACDQWGVSTYIDDMGNGWHLSTYAVLRSEFLASWSPFHWLSSDMSERKDDSQHVRPLQTDVTIGYGEPAYVQLELSGKTWLGSRDLDALDVRATASCDGNRSSLLAGANSLSGVSSAGVLLAMFGGLLSVFGPLIALASVFLLIARFGPASGKKP